MLWADVELRGVDVLLFEFKATAQGSTTASSPWLNCWLRGMLEFEPRFEELRGVRVLDVTRDLTSNDYFRLDPHANAEGHAKVARVLSRELESARAPFSASSYASFGTTGP